MAHTTSPNYCWEAHLGGITVSVVVPTSGGFNKVGALLESLSGFVGAVELLEIVLAANGSQADEFAEDFKVASREVV